MRVAIRIVAAVLAFILLLVIAAFALLQTEAGGWAAARALSTLASTPGEMEVRIERIGPGLPGRIAISGLAIADADGEWLAADEARVQWRPLALMRGRLSVAEASAAGLRLSRLPQGEAEAEADDQEFSLPRLPRLPLDLQVDSFRFDDVVLGEAVAGEVMTLGAHGQIAARRQGGVTTEAEIVRTDGVGGAVRLAAHYQPEGERLSFDLRADEPEGGVIGAGLGLDGRPPVRLAFAGDGPVSNWRGRLDGRVGEAIRLSADVASETTGEGARLEVAGDARVAALLPQAARALGEDGIGFAVALRRPEAGMLTIDGAEVTAEGVELQAAGRLLLDDERFDDVRLTLSVVDATALAPLLAPVTMEAAQIEAALSGAWAAPSATIAAGLVGVGAADASVAGSAVHASVTAGDGGALRVDAEATLTGVRAAGTDVDAVLAAPPRLRLSAGVSAAADEVSVETAELLTPALTATGRGVYGLGSGEGTASVRALAADLAAFSGVAGGAVAGSAALAVDARLAGGVISAGLGAASSGFRSGIAAADALLGAAPSLRAALRLDPDTRDARLEHVLMVGDGMRATAAATLKDGSLAGEYRVNVPDVAPAGAAAGVAAGGALTLAGGIAGLAADPEATAVLTLAEGEVAGIGSPLRIELDAKSLVTNPRGLMSASASAAGEPLRLAVPFARDQRGMLRLGPIEGSGAGAQLSGTLSLPPAGGPILGTLTLEAGRVGQPVALAGHRLDGEAQLRLELGERNGEQTVDVTGNGRSLALATPDGPLGAAESLSLRASLAGTDDPRGAVTLSLVRPAAGGVSLAALDARLTGAPADARYEIVARPEGDPAEALRAQGALSQDTGGSRFTVASLAGRLGGHDIALGRPLVITQNAGETVIGDLDVLVGGGGISGGGRTGAAGTEGRFGLRDLPLSLVQAMAPGLPLTGMLNGEGSVRTEGRDLAGRLAVRASAVRAGPAGGAPPVEASAVATTGSGAAALEVRVPSLGGSPLVLDARVPARVDARTLAVDVSEEAPLQGRLVWSGAVARLWELAPLTDQRLTGDADIDLTLAGTVTAPEFGGRASLSGGRYEHFLTETVIDQLSLQARPTGAGGMVLTLRGTDGGSGSLRGDGRVTLAGGMTALVDFALSFDEATLVRRDDVTAALSGQIAFRQDRTGASLSGELTSERIEIRLIDRLPPSVVVLDVTEINLPPGHAPTRIEPAAEADAIGLAIGLDIAVKLPRRVFVRGRGLESEWEGELRVSGSSADPRLIGVVAVRSGTFDFAGRRFTLETGEIGFTGGATVNPTLNVQAVRTTPDLTAIVRVTGTALDPTVELASTPALPESEILSRVLFEKVGLDVLTIEAGEEEGEGPALGVGRYVADGVYVGARQGVAEDSTAGTVEIEVLPGLAIESEVSEGAEGATGALGLRWKWDY